MKTIIRVGIVAVSLLCATAKAQDGIAVAPDLASTSVGRVLSALANSPGVVPETNLTLVVYASHAKGLVDAKGNDASWGGGFALVHPIDSQGYASAGLRMQWLAGDVYIPSLTANVQTTKNLFGIPNAYVTTFGFGGAVLPVGGTTENGNLSLTYGVGASIKYRIKPNLEIGVAYGIEFWPGLNVNRLEHFGPVIHWAF